MKLRTKKGFSIVEVMVSIVCLGILFGCIIGLIITSNNLQLSSSQKYNAITRVNELLDEFTANPSDSKFASGEAKIYYNKYYTIEQNAETEWLIIYTVIIENDFKTIQVDLGTNSYSRTIKVTP